MKYTLHIKPPQGRASKVPLPDRGSVSIGRGSGADIKVADGQVSREHLRFECSPSGIDVIDLGSRNGTLLNGRRIERPVRLNPGDVVAAGGTELILECSAGQGPPPGPGAKQDFVCLSCAVIGPEICRTCGPRFALPAGAIAGLTIEKVLGKGGMGAVFRARSVQQKGPVALKVMTFADRPDPVKMKRFFREARVQAKFQHGNIVKILGTGMLKTRPPAGGAAASPVRAAYIVMEYVEGRDLHAVVKDSGPMDLKLALRISMKIADVLAEAWRKGVVHRDIKPSNVVLSGSGVVKVMDFGLAKCLDGAGLSNLTVTGSAFGTPAYMPPEQIQDAKSAGHKADLYSFGATCFFLLTARHPFEGGKIAALLKKIQSEKPPAVEALRPGTPPPLCALVSKCLEKRPEDRFGNAEELRGELERIFSSL